MLNDDGEPEYVLSRITEQVTVPITLHTCVEVEAVEADLGGLFQGNIPGFREAEGPNQTSWKPEYLRTASLEGCHYSNLQHNEAVWEKYNAADWNL